MTLSPLRFASLALITASLVLTVVTYQSLPDPVPTHWNVRGEIDGYTAKPLGAILPPIIMIGTFLLFLVVPRISPKGFLMDSFPRAYDVVQFSTIAFLFVVGVAATLAGLGRPIAMDRVIVAALGVLFIVLGNFMGKITRNFFVGIRTPWTLASEEVWLRTHRFGGRVFVLAGLLVLIGAVLGVHMLPMLAILITLALVPVIYSYVIYRKVENGEKTP